MNAHQYRQICTSSLLFKRICGSRAWRFEHDHVTNNQISTDVNSSGMANFSVEYYESLAQMKHVKLKKLVKQDVNNSIIVHCQPLN